MVQKFQNTSGEIAKLGLLRTFQQTKIYTKMNCVDNMQISVSHRRNSKNGIKRIRRGSRTNFIFCWFV